MKIGVVSFSGDASIVQSPTSDKTLVIAAINRLRPQRATAIGRAILVSLDAIAESQGSEADLPSSILQNQGQPDASARPRPSATIPPYLVGQHASASIVLMSDGQNNQFPAPLDIVDQATSRGVRIYTIGLGSAAGAIVRLQGRAVRTALDEGTLKKIAEVTDGRYFNANTEADLRTAHITYRRYKPQAFCRVAYRLNVAGEELELDVRACRAEDVARWLEDGAPARVAGPLGPGRSDLIPNCSIMFWWSCWVVQFKGSGAVPELGTAADWPHRRPADIAMMRPAAKQADKK